jgi:NADPH-dependent 2,4-dienoyl-CoA reductase/sulfur reductase-like enzyme
MRCTVNPAAGYEKFLDEELIVKAETPKTVMIVGGGPAGLEAARIAALGGHKVILAEAGARLGGALQAAKRAPNLHILGDLLDWQERQVFALGVDVRLSTYVEADDVLAVEPDVVIIATGGMTTGDGRQALIPGELPAGMGLSHVFDPAALLLGPQQSLEGKSALVFDDVGRYDAIAAAEYLQRAGAAVTFVTSLSSFAPKMLGTSRDVESLMRLNQGGEFRLMVNHNLLAIEPGFASIRALGVERLDRVPADVVAVVTNQVPVRNLYDELRHKVADVRLVGDALSPRDLLAAMADGHRFARTI